MLQNVWQIIIKWKQIVTGGRQYKVENFIKLDKYTVHCFDFNISHVLWLLPYKKPRGNTQILLTVVSVVK